MDSKLTFDPKNLVSIDCDKSVIDAVLLMKKKKVDALLVKEHGQVSGIFTEKDIVTKIDHRKKDELRNVQLKYVMTTGLKTVEYDDINVDIINTMHRHNIRHMPVVKGESIIGIISLRDLLNHYKEHLEELLDEREKQLREQLRETKQQEEKFKTIFSNSAVAITLADKDERIVECNHFTEQLLGVGNEELKGKLVKDLYPPEEWKRIRSQNIRQFGMRHHLETKVYNKWKECIDVDISISVLKDHEGNVVGSIGIMRDITERKKLEQSKAEQYKTVVDNINDVIFRLSPIGTIQFVSPKIEDISGNKAQDLVGKPFKSIVPKSCEKEAQQALKRALSGEQNVVFEASRLTNEGTLVVYDIEISIIEEEGMIAALQGVMRDATEKKAAERKLEAEREQLLSIFDSISEPCYVADTSTYEILFANKALREILNKDPLGKVCYKELQGFEEPCKFCTNDIIKKLKGEAYFWEFHNSVSNKDYQICDKIVKWPDGRDVRFEFAIDVTKRKKMEQDLAENEEKYRLLAANIKDFIWTMDMDLKFTFVSPSVKSMLGYTEEEAQNKNFLEEILTLDSKEQFDKAMAGGLAESAKGIYVTKTLILEHMRKDKTLIWVELSTSFIFNEKGDPLGIVGITRDITSRKHAEEALLESEKKYREQFEGAVDAMFVADPETFAIIDCNRAAAKLTARTREELMGKSCSILFASEEMHETTFSKCSNENLGEIVEAEIVTKEGKKRSVSIKAGMVEFMGKTMIQATIRDISDRKKAEKALEEAYQQIKNTQQQLLQHTKDLEELNKKKTDFLDMLTHELRTPVTVMVGLADFLVTGKFDSKSGAEYLEMFKQEVTRLEEIMSEIILANQQNKRETTFGLDELNVDEIVDEMITKVEKFLKLRKQNVVTEIESGGLKIKGDRQKIITAIYNLVQNASRFSEDDNEITVRVKEMEDNALISIEDNGIGIEEDKFSLIFNPFYEESDIMKHHSGSFEFKSSRLGMGLYIAKGIVEKHKGKILVESKMGEGSKFTIVIPLAKKDEKQHKKSE